MKGFIEVTDTDRREKVLINVAHIVYVMDRKIIVNNINIHSSYRSCYGGTECIDVDEQYDEICNKIMQAA